MQFLRDLILSNSNLHLSFHVHLSGCPSLSHEHGIIVTKKLVLNVRFVRTTIDWYTHKCSDILTILLLEIVSLWIRKRFAVFDEIFKFWPSEVGSASNFQKSWIFFDHSNYFDEAPRKVENIYRESLAHYIVSTSFIFM